MVATRTGQSLRAAIDVLRAAGELVTVDREIDADYEMTAILERGGTGPAIWFNHVRGYDLPAVGNVLSSRRKMALALGIPEGDLLQHVLHSLDNPIEPRLVETAACLEVEVPADTDLRTLFPIGKHCEREQGPYIMSGLLVAKDPTTGKRNVSINRALVLPGGRLMIGMSPSHHLFRLANRAWEQGKALEFAITIGNHPAVLLASNAYVGIGDDELGYAGAMIGEPIDVVRCRTIDVEVPADAEIVIECELRAGERHEEGWVSEFTGGYENYGPSPAARIRAISHRRDPLFQQIAASRSAEHMLIGGVMIEATVFRAVEHAVPCVRDVRVPLGGTGRVHCILALHDPLPGEAQRAVFAALAHANVLKHVTVVDDDIDIDDPTDVEWALATRFRAERDILVYEGVKADRCEPMKENGTIAKWALIALKNRYKTPEEYTRARAPEAVRAAVAANWDAYFDRPFPTRAR
jgi:2,5-furandicarboxylate decarboxylase 1